MMNVFKRSLFFLILCIIACEKPMQSVNHYTADYEVQFQEKESRTFREIKVEKKLEIHYDTLDSILYNPVYCAVNKKNEVYIFDISTYLFHKFSFNGMKYVHTVFGNGRGQGPGELGGPVSDFQVKNNRLYVSQPDQLAIAVYDTKGNFIRDISFDPHNDTGVRPQKFTVLSDNEIVVVTLEDKKKNELFVTVDSLGNRISTFGSYLYGSSEGGYVLHQCLFLPHDPESFYMFEINLNVVGLFKKQKNVYVKAGIDGIFGTEGDIKRFSEDYGYRTVTKVKNVSKSINDVIDFQQEKCIIVTTDDRKKKVSYCDVYSKGNFSYLFSITNFPKARFYCINGTTLYCSNDSTLRVYEIDKDNFRM